MTASRRAALVVGAGVGAYVAYRLLSGSGEETAADPSLIGGRIWIDSRPEKHVDYRQEVYVSSYGKFGFFEKASSYDFRMEIFEHRREGASLKVHFPQTKKDAEITFTITACNELPPYDLCLKLSSNPWGSATSFYSHSRSYDAASDEERARDAAFLARIKASPLQE